ncbi:MAG: hypothetical protein IKL07_08945 [Clostridium sp.]|nr:hypothetical protein [Clostridium sp.]
MIDSKYNRYVLELVHNRKVNVTNQDITVFSYVYQQIRNISKNAPVYLIYPTEDIQHFAESIKDLSLQLEDFLKQLISADTDNPLHQLHLVPPPSQFITVKLLEEQPASPLEYEVHIDAVAKGQRNEGAFCSPNLCPFTTQTYVFSIMTEEDDFDFEIPVTNSTTNKDVLTRISELINRTSTGLVASLIYNQHSNVALSIEAVPHQKNRPAHFTLKDEIPNGLIEYYNLNTVTSMPTQSDFTVNNERVTSYGVAFIIDDLFEFTLHEPCEQNIKLKFELNREVITAEMENLQQLINHMLTLSKENQSKILEKGLLAILFAHKEELSKVGLELNENNLLYTIPDRLEQSIENRTLEQLFTDEQSFTTELIEHAKNITIDPMKYVPNKIVSYKDFSQIHYPNPYLTSMYSGFLFASYC